MHHQLSVSVAAIMGNNIDGLDCNRKSIVFSTDAGTSLRCAIAHLMH